MGNEREGVQRGLIRIAKYGAIGAALFLSLTFAASALGGRRPELLLKSALLIKGLLCLSAFLCGSLCARRANERRILYALAGEWALLLICVICAFRFQNEHLLLSFGLNLLLCVFGAFAGTIAFGGNKRRRRRRE